MWGINHSDKVLSTVCSVVQCALVKCVGLLGHLKYTENVSGLHLHTMHNNRKSCMSFWTNRHRVLTEEPVYCVEHTWHAPQCSSDHTHTRAYLSDWTCWKPSTLERSSSTQTTSAWAGSRRCTTLELSLFQEESTHTADLCHSDFCLTWCINALHMKCFVLEWCKVFIAWITLVWKLFSTNTDIYTRLINQHEI